MQSMDSALWHATPIQLQYDCNPILPERYAEEVKMFATTRKLNNHEWGPGPRPQGSPTGIRTNSQKANVPVTSGLGVQVSCVNEKN